MQLVANYVSPIYFVRSVAKRFPYKLSQVSRIFAIVFLCLLLIVAVFADYLSSEKPIYVHYQGKIYYPLFTAQTEFDSLPNPRSGKQTWQTITDADWKHISYQKAVWTFCPFDTKYTGKSKLQKPFSAETILIKTESHHFTHLLGTDIQDIDVLASLIKGARTSLWIGGGSLLLIAFVGLTLGGMAGYFGDTKWQMTRGQQYGIVLGILLGIFYGFYLLRYDISIAFSKENEWKGIAYLILGFFIFMGNIVFFAWLGKKMSFLPFLNQRKAFPLDSIITQITDIQMALPTILIVVSLSLMLPKSILSLIFIIGCSCYMGIARMARSLTSQIRNLPYIEAAEAIGMSQIRILWKHILPNVLPAISSILLLSMADLILLEAAFSFLNIGVPIEVVSWGKILNQARNEPTAWWLSLFPALMIAVTAGSLKILGTQK